MSWALLPVVVLDERVRELCRRSYPLHPRGCPNFGKRASCPPEAPRFEDCFSASGAWCIWNEFNFGAHVARMREKHPDWSERQLACCLYWQAGARKQLESEIQKFYQQHLNLWLVRCPEAMGVDLTATMQLVGVELQWPPRTRTYQVALACERTARRVS